MRQIFLSLLLVVLTKLGFAQLKFQGSFIPGPTPNSVDLVIKPNLPFSGYLTNVIFVIQIPTGITPQPSMNVVSLSTNFSQLAFAPTTDANTDLATPSFRNYQFGATNANTTSINIAAGVSYPVARVTFSGGPITPTSIRLAHLTDGGVTSQFQFYVEANWNGTAAADYTNYVQMFYGSAVFPTTPLADEGVGYSTYQYTQIMTILPVRWLNFSVVRQASDALISWTVDNDSDNEKYVVERSLDGYSYTDTRNVRLDVKGDISLFPNPATDGFTLNIPYLNPNQDKIQLQLVSAIGQIIDRRDITRQAATSYYYNLTSSLITSGDYLLKIFEDGQLTETKRVLIKK
ncbi:MAG: T9SS type A sorting domain-containing protein [Chitinophagaceae bacterium]|nr:MAG: T9SS type A sorting domain-containing protein [Chitinophagaceae bacterium]